MHSTQADLTCTRKLQVPWEGVTALPQHLLLLHSPEQTPLPVTTTVGNGQYGHGKAARVTERAVTGVRLQRRGRISPAPWEADGLDPRTSFSLLIAWLSQLTRTTASLSGKGTSTSHPYQASPGSKVSTVCSKRTRQSPLRQLESWPFKNQQGPPAAMLSSPHVTVACFLPCSPG